MRRYLAVLMMLAVTFWTGNGILAGVADFDDLSLSAESYWNGSDSSGDFSSGSASFNNNYNTTYNSWDGFAYSNLSQENPPLTGVAGQYTAITGAGESPSNYAIGYIGYSELPTMTLDCAMQLDEVYITNNNYVHDSLLNGDAFGKQFGGASGDDPDWFLLSIEGFDEQEASTGTVGFYLADYRFADNGLDYIIDDWTSVDLSSLGAVKKVSFSLSSSDNGLYGMNTPAYFALDTVIPEPSTCLLMCLSGLMMLRRRS